MEHTRQPQHRLPSVGTIGKWTAVILLTLLLLLELVVVGIGVFGGDDAVSDLPFFILEIRSDSMHPVLKKGDCVFSVDVPYSTLKEGDIITYIHNGDLITHQIVTVAENGSVITQGLMNSYTDGKISPEAYVGKMVCKLPALRLFLQLTETAVGKLCFIAVVLLLCFAYPLIIKLFKIDTSEKKRLPKGGRHGGKTRH